MPWSDANDYAAESGADERAQLPHWIGEITSNPE